MGESATADWCASEEAPAPSQDARQLIKHCVEGAWRHLGWRRLLMTGFLRDVLVRHFSNPRFIEEPDLRAAIWQETAPTGILIESIWRWRGDLTEKRPAVIIKPNAYKNVRVLHNDFVGTNEEGNECFATIWVGSHTLFCIHGSGAGAEILGAEVQRELTQFGPQIARTFNLKKFQVTGVGGISELEEATENFLVPVTVGWAYEEVWTLEPEALRFAGMKFTFNLDC